MVFPAQQTLHLLDGVGHRSRPLCPFFPSPPWCSFMAGIWKLFLFTQHHQVAAARCAPANGNLGFPAGPFQRRHAKQPAVLQGTSGPCYISVEEALPSVQTGHPGLSACPLDGEPLSYFEADFLLLFCILVPVSSGLSFSSFSCSLPVILVHLPPGLIALIQGG